VVISGTRMLDRAQIQHAISVGDGVPSGAVVGPPSFLVPGRHLKLHPDDQRRARRTSRRHRRALVLIDDERRQRTGRPPMKASATRAWTASGFG
jgi:hypothetical protein